MQCIILTYNTKAYQYSMKREKLSSGRVQEALKNGSFENDQLGRRGKIVQKNDYWRKANQGRANLKSAEHELSWRANGNLNLRKANNWSKWRFDHGRWPLLNWPFWRCWNDWWSLRRIIHRWLLDSLSRISQWVFQNYWIYSPRWFFFRLGKETFFVGRIKWVFTRDDILTWWCWFDFVKLGVILTRSRLYGRWILWIWRHLIDQN